MPATAMASTCNGNLVEQIVVLKRLCFHSCLSLCEHQSGAIAHHTTPLKSKAGSCWEAVWRHQPLLHHLLITVQEGLSSSFSWMAPQCFLQLRLDSQGLSTAAGCLADDACVERADRVCLSCSKIVLGNFKQLNVLSLCFCNSNTPLTDMGALFCSAGSSENSDWQK